MYCSGRSLALPRKTYDHDRPRRRPSDSLTPKLRASPTLSRPPLSPFPQSLHALAPSLPDAVVFRPSRVPLRVRHFERSETSSPSQELFATKSLCRGVRRPSTFEHLPTSPGYVRWSTRNSNRLIHFRTLFRRNGSPIFQPKNSRSRSILRRFALPVVRNSFVFKFFCTLLHFPKCYPLWFHAIARSLRKHVRRGSAAHPNLPNFQPANPLLYNPPRFTEIF